MAAATITLKLDVIPGGPDSQGIVLVPGQEPPSDSTSNTLLANMRGKAATAKVADILAAIPGSYILYGDNWGNHLGVRKRWLVFPPYEPGCCTAIPDYYAIVRSLATIEEPEYEKFDACDVFGADFCPAPGWEDTPAPPPDPYQPEGESPYGYVNISAGVPPPWNNPNPVKQIPGQGIYHDEQH